ncbi:VCBS domain-containing protein [Bradyrhizobium lupini]|uniref:VCBS domain-containing protein n=1 Tax=Rhizobium lupini TaxID=136996 RepID=UPI0034C5D1AE
MTITLTGTNDTPVAVADTNSGLEDSTITGSVATNDSDVDDGATLTYAQTSAVAGLTINADGSYSFEASNAAYQHLAEGATQVVVANYTVTDEHGASAPSTLTITLTGTNDTPVAVADTNSGLEDSTITGSVATNDSDVDDGATLTYAQTSAVAGLTINADGSYSFEASNAAYQHLAEGATQVVVANYTVTDEHGASAPSTLTITLTGTNDTPVAVADTNSGLEDSTITGSVATNDSDVDDGATLTYAQTSAVAGLTINADGSYSFEASNAAYQHLAEGATQVVVANYTVTDEHGASAPSTLTITLTGTNDTPVAVADTNSGLEDSTITGSVATNDSDVDDGATLTYAQTSAVAGLTINADGSYSFEASNAAYQHLAEGATQVVVANYTVTDEHGASAPSTLTITLTGTNDTPVAVADTNSGLEDSTITGSVATNDSDVDDGATLTYAQTSAVAGLTINADGSYSFEASNAAYQHLAEGATQVVVANYTVTDEHGASAPSTLTITLTGTNDTPVAVADTNSGLEDSTITGSVATNDSDVDDGATLTYAQTSAVAGLTINADGSYSFEASNAAYQHLAEGATQVVVANYTVTDEHGASAPSTLTITLTGTNDTPVAVADTNSGLEDSTITGSVATNDSDVDDGATLTYAQTSAVAGLTINADGSYSFEASNAAYQHLAEGATQVVVANYTVTDEHGASAPSTLTITLTGTNDTPVAVADTNSGLEDSTITGSVATNDSDVDDGATLTYAQTSAVAGLTINADGSYSFEASNAAYQHLAEGATQVVVANYTVTDEHGASAPSTLTITLTGTNDTPVAVADTNSGLEDSTITGSVATNDSDVDDGATLTYAQTSAVAGLTINADGSYSFEASNAAYQHLAEGATQVVVANYTVTDEHGASAPSTLTITLTGTNDTPVAVADTNSGLEDSTITGSVATNDSDVDDGATLTYAQTSAVAGLTINADGSYSFEASNAAYQHLAEGATQVVVANYTVTDEHGASAPSTLTITLTGTNDTPVAVAGHTLNYTENHAATAIDPALTVSDVDNANLVSATVQITGNYVNGQDVLGFTNQNGITGSFNAATGMLTLTGSSSVANYQTALDSVTYFNTSDNPSGLARTVTIITNDGAANSVAVTDMINVTPVNDAPALATTSTLAYTENQAATAINTALTVTDADNPTLTSGTVSITANFVSGQDILAFTNVPATMGNIAGSYNGATGVMTLTSAGGTATLAQWQAAERAVTYANSSDNPSTLARTVTYTVDDGQGVNHASNGLTSTINITAVNDAPALATTSALAYTENQAATAINTALTVTDADNPTLTSGTVSITANFVSGQDILAFTNVPATMGNIAGSYNGATGVMTLTSAGGTATLAQWQAAERAVTYANSSDNPSTLARTVTYTVDDGQGVNHASNGLTSTINITAVNDAPVNTVPATSVNAGNGSGTATFSGASLISISDVDAGSGSVTVSLSLGASAQSLTGILTLATTTGLTFNAGANATKAMTFTGTITDINNALNGMVFSNGSNNSTRTLTITTNDNGNSGSGGSHTDVDTVSVVKGNGSTPITPAGTAGEAINLALPDQSLDHLVAVTANISGIPSGWILSEGAVNSDGSWTVVTNDIASLAITSPSNYTGALVLNVTETWTNTDGSTGSAIAIDNVEAYAPGSPIFALSGDDNLTGSSGHDMFVFSQPIGHDVIYSFDATSDRIDLIGYANFTGFGDIQAHMANDAAGNAVITLADGQSITLNGVDASSLTASDFIFDQTPVTENAGHMVISDGAILPLSGVIDNTGTMELNSTGDETDLQLIEHGITLQGGGHVDLSDSSENVITGTVSDVTLTNVDNTISGAGHLGDGVMVLVNEGTIIATGTNALDIDTGSNAVTNTGTLEATGTGGLEVHSDLINTGVLWANGGNVTIDGNVSGNGTAQISGSATLEFGAASSANVALDAQATGTIVLHDSFDFSGVVSGFNGDDHLDLLDVAFGAGTTASYVANQAGTGGTLSVTDGVHTANITLLGQYDPAGFQTEADKNTGTLISYHDHLA